MGIIDTSAVDQGSADSIIHDIVSPLNEMAMGWYSIKTGKGLVSGPGVVAGLDRGTTLAEATPAVLSQQPVATQIVQNPTVILFAVIAIVVVALLVEHV